MDFKVIGDFDWYEKLPFEIAITYPNQYFNNEKYERFTILHPNKYFYNQEGQTFTLSDFAEVITVVNTRAFDALSEDIGKQKLLNEFGNVLKFEHLGEYFFEYHKGFLEGYNEFDTDVINATHIFKNDIAIANKVFSEIKLTFNRSKGFSIGCFDNDYRKPAIKKQHLYKDGIETGRIYKAWHFIVENPNLFVELFRADSKAVDFYKVALRYWEGRRSGSGDRLKILLSEIEKSEKDKSIPVESGLTLKSQFIDPDKYDEVIEKLVANDNIQKHQSGKLIFIKCHRRGTRYGVEALRLVLKDLEYLNSQSNLTNAQIVEIHKNTYYDFNIDVRTLNQRDSISVAYQYFKDILS